MKKLFSILNFIVFATIFANAQKTNDVNQLPLDKDVVYGTLPNGMKYYIRHNEFPKERADFYIVHNVGAILENDDQNGLAHFTEHMAFNGTKNFPKKGIIDFMQKNGVAFGHNVNAFTAHDVTCYNLNSVPVTRQTLIDSTLLILHDWSGFISFEPAEIDAERGVIHEEWRTGRGADGRMSQKTDFAMYNNSKYAKRDVIGDTAVIDHFKHETILSFYNDWYRPDLQALIVVGDIDPKTIENSIKKIFADIPKREKANEKERYKVTIPDNTEPLIATATDPEASRTYVQLIYKQKAQTKKDLEYYKNLWKSALYDKMYSARLKEITQKENPPFVLAYNYYGNLVSTMEALYCVAFPKDNQSLTALESLLTENKRLVSFGFTQGELDRAKAALLSEQENKFKEKGKTESNDYVWLYFSNFLENEPAPGAQFEYDFTKKYIPEITLADINKLPKQRIADKNMVILITGIEDKNLPMPSVNEIKEVVKKVKNLKVEPYSEKVSTSPLIKQVPKEAAIMKESSENGITEWTYANGVKVIIKQTDFKDDEILMKAFKWGGYSTVKTEDINSASFAAQLADAQGISEFSLTELEKKLAGKQFSVTPFLNTEKQGLTGNSSQKDFETLIQLSYLYFTEPRTDKTAFAAFMQKTEAMIGNKEANPAAVFRDSVSWTNTNYNIRRKPLNKETLAGVNLDVANKIYKDKFSDAAGFVFVFVGNIKPENVKSLISTYIGNLPATNKNETCVDENVRAPKGVVKKKITLKMQDEKCTVFVNFHNEFAYNSDAKMQMAALKYILSMRYTESIREKEGGSYGVGVYFDARKIPFSRYAFMIYFDCNPDKIEKLTNLVYDEIKKIQESGPTAEDVQKTIEYFKKQRAENMKKNDYWLENLEEKYSTQTDLISDSEFEKNIANLNTENLKSSAVKYLDMQSYIEMIMMPKH